MDGYKKWIPNSRVNDQQTLRLISPTRANTRDRLFAPTSGSSLAHAQPPRLTARVNPTIYAPATPDAPHRTVYSPRPTPKVDRKGQPYYIRPCHPTPDAPHRTVYSRVDPCGQPGARPRCHSFPPELSFANK